MHAFFGGPHPCESRVGARMRAGEKGRSVGVRTKRGVEERVGGKE